MEAENKKKKKVVKKTASKRTKVPDSYSRDDLYNGTTWAQFGNIPKKKK